MKLLAVALAIAIAPSAAAITLKQNLADVGFLAGHWDAGVGTVADTGGTSKGFADITVEANGMALISKGHTDLFDAKGAPAGQYFQILLIYPENGTLRADYLDGVHVIHYTHAAVTPGKSVTLSSSPGDGPIFQLTYNLQAPDALAVTFGMIPPGQSTFQPIASGTLHKSQP